ncbi:MAG: hypothetical protein FJ405_14960 [Verrucomicrobia bacterium]|nr:hypothetical protein [Verrucomicrobiota bacterium]
MNELELKQLLEDSWKRPLTQSEVGTIRDWVKAHPARQAEVEQELALSGVIHRLPDAPVSSNFNSQVWQKIEASDRADQRSRSRSPSSLESIWRRWVPRLAGGLAILTVTILVLKQPGDGSSKQAASGLAAAAVQAEGLDPAMFEDFEAIRTLAESDTALDVELLAALQP